MKEVKDSVRSIVRIGYDGKVYKIFKGTDAEKRYATEVEVLEHLKENGCQFVPQLLEKDDGQLQIVTTNCGHPVAKMGKERQEEIFRELEDYGVRHSDQFLRNITYDHQRGRFCVIDFELAEIL